MNTTRQIAHNIMTANGHKYAAKLVTTNQGAKVWVLETIVNGEWLGTAYPSQTGSREEALDAWCAEIAANETPETWQAGIDESLRIKAEWENAKFDI